MKRTICNPINISYQHQYHYLSRESADPAVVLYGDEYFLFASHGSGYWVSDDLADWKFIEVDVKKQPEFELFAPAVLVIGKRIYLAHSQGGCMMYSDDPHDPDSWINIGKPYHWEDPAMILDDDGFVYMYDGLSQDKPLRVAKLDPNNNMSLVEGPYDIFDSDMPNRGWERFENDYSNETRRPSLEGAWVNKIGGKYYLTYASPGTELFTYADGCAVSDHPMGPFVYCENSPVVYKATGFQRGAGHGCLFEDKNGNLWKMDTSAIAVNFIFERRINLFPAKIGADGNLYTNTYRGDYPMITPDQLTSAFDTADAGWNLLSYKKKVWASSVLDEKHTPDLSADENMSTWWSAASSDIGEWLMMDLGKVYSVCAVQVNFADQDITRCHGRNPDFSYKFTVEFSVDGENWSMLRDMRDNTADRSHEYFPLDEETELRYLRVTNCGEVPAHSKFAVCGLRVFGHGGSSAPEKAPAFELERFEDPRNMKVTWESVENAQGYIVRFGVNPDELHTHWQVFGDCEAVIGCLNRFTGYYVTVDAFNESGTAYGTEIKKI